MIYFKEMNLPYSEPKNRQTVWQNILALPLKIKIIGVFTIVIIFAGTAAFIVWRAVQQPASSTAVTPDSEQPKITADNTPETDSADTQKTEEQKQEEVKSNTPLNQQGATPNASGSSTPGGGPTVPPPTTPPSNSNRPTEANTGPTVTLASTYGGAASNGDSDQIYEATDFPVPGSPGYYIFSGNNLTFRNCYIHGNGVLFSGDTITIENCIIEGGVSLSGTNGVTFRYNEVVNFSGDGIHLTSDSGQAANINIAHNYIHNPTPNCGDHADGIQVRGVNNLTLLNNTFDMGPWVQVCGQDALNAAIFFESANGGNSNITIDSNYLNGAGITLRLNPGSNQKIINNRFGRDYKYGVVNNQTNTGDIIQQTGNVMDDNGSIVNF